MDVSTIATYLTGTVIGAIGVVGLAKITVSAAQMGYQKISGMVGRG